MDTKLSGPQIVEHREKLGLRQKDLAKLMGLDHSPSVMSKIEKGTRPTTHIEDLFLKLILKGDLPSLPDNVSNQPICLRLSTYQKDLVKKFAAMDGTSPDQWSTQRVVDFLRYLTPGSTTVAVDPEHRNFSYRGQKPSNLTLLEWMPIYKSQHTVESLSRELNITAEEADEYLNSERIIDEALLKTISDFIEYDGLDEEDARIAYFSLRDPKYKIDQIRKRIEKLSKKGAATKRTTP